MKACRVLLADNHSVVRRGLRALLERRKNCEVVGEATSGEMALKMAGFLGPDVMITDISLENQKAIEEANHIFSSCEDAVGVMLFTMHNSERICRMASEAGVRGYVLKTDPEENVVECVDRICDGGAYFSPSVAQHTLPIRDSNNDNGQHPNGELSLLTPRQIDVLRLLAMGKTNKEVAEALSISARTAEAHRTQLMDRLKVRTVSELVILALRNQLIEI